MNDLENQLIGNPTGLEWKYTEEDTWASYTEEQPDLSGDKTLIVRAAATGIYQADTKTTTYQFTKGWHRCCTEIYFNQTFVH